MDGQVDELFGVASLPEVCGEIDSFQMRQVLGEVLVHSRLDVVVNERKFALGVGGRVLQDALRKHSFDQDFGAFAANPLKWRTVQHHRQCDEHVELLLWLPLWCEHGERFHRCCFGRREHCCKSCCRLCHLEVFGWRSNSGDISCVKKRNKFNK